MDARAKRFYIKFPESKDFPREWTSLIEKLVTTAEETNGFPSYPLSKERDRRELGIERHNQLSKKFKLVGFGFNMNIILHNTYALSYL